MFSKMTRRSERSEEQSSDWPTNVRFLTFCTIIHAMSMAPTPERKFPDSFEHLRDKEVVLALGSNTGLDQRVLFAELEALGEGEVVAPVDSVRLAAHVELP